MAIIEAFPLPEPPSCVVGEEWRGRVVVITVAGDLDLLTAPDLEACIEVALRKQPTAMIIDLSSVDFLASRGMEVLLGARDSAPADVDVFVVADGPATSRPLRLIGIPELVPLFANVDEAYAATTRREDE